MSAVVRPPPAQCLEVERAGAVVGEAAVPEVLPDLAEIDPAELFARAFVDAHGYEPEATHRRVFDLLRGEV